MKRMTIRVDDLWADHILRLGLMVEDGETFTVESLELVAEDDS